MVLAEKMLLQQKEKRVTAKIFPNAVIKGERVPQFSYLRSFIQDLDWAFRELGCGQQSMELIENIAIFIETSLSKESRRYHGVAHVYKITAGATPLQVLAAFFRDIVKETINESILDSQQEYLNNFFEEGTSIIRADLSDTRDLIVARIFGFQPGSDVSKIQGWDWGMDMLKSAVVASRLLKDVISPEITAKLCACIEATIPFRVAARGITHFELLYRKLGKCNADLKLGLTKEEMLITVQQGCDLWNRQVGNMVSEDAAVFLDHTWSLLPEHAQPLRRTALYTLSDYHSAMVAMDDFLSSLNGRSLYMDFRGVPSHSEIKSFRKTFQTNRAIAVSYVRARLVSVSIISAMAFQTGGDGPKSYFFGDVYAMNKESVNLGELVDVPSERDVAPSCDLEVFDLLRYGEERLMDAGFDHRNTGVSAFLYAYMGEQDISFFVNYCRETPMTPELSMRVLTLLPLNEVIRPILKAFRFMAKTREPAAQSLLTRLEEHEANLAKEKAVKASTRQWLFAVNQFFSGGVNRRRRRRDRRQSIIAERIPSNEGKSTARNLSILSAGRSSSLHVGSRNSSMLGGRSRSMLLGGRSQSLVEVRTKSSIPSV